MNKDTSNRILEFLEDNEDLVNTDDWGKVFAKFYIFTKSSGGLSFWDLAPYLHELGFDPLPYMISVVDRMYYSCSSIETINVPNSVTSIGAAAFSGCSNLTSIEIPDSVTSIGSSAFYYCSGLTSITIPDRVTSIGSNAFDGCSSLTSVTIGNSVISIGWYAFYNCRGLRSITYNGTKSQWNKIKKGDYWNNYVPAKVVRCSDGDVDLEV